ncbi:hypothetical protein, partial [Enterococcus casseliflavus]|uniref:hypothetical protein n=1 Tax=Enterococcus casseliflavus TaxID=37734 RepID=UPI003D129EBE
ALQAARADRNLWMIGLVGSALVFNPLFTVTVPPPLMVWTIAAAIAIQIGWAITRERTVAPRAVADVLRPKGLVE